MATLRISGVWKNSDGIITHYAIHTETGTTMTLATKTSKADAIKLVETAGNTCTTMLWNYKTARWVNAEPVHVVHGNSGKYLRSDPDNQITDNLGHLIDYDWIRL